MRRQVWLAVEFPQALGHRTRFNAVRTVLGAHAYCLHSYPVFTSARVREFKDSGVVFHRPLFDSATLPPGVGLNI